jgi:hypothetical protein
VGSESRAMSNVNDVISGFFSLSSSNCSEYDSGTTNVTSVLEYQECDTRERRG